MVEEPEANTVETIAVPSTLASLSNKLAKKQLMAGNLGQTRYEGPCTLNLKGRLGGKIARWIATVKGTWASLARGAKSYDYFFAWLLTGPIVASLPFILKYGVYREDPATNPSLLIAPLGLMAGVASETIPLMAFDAYKKRVHSYWVLAGLVGLAAIVRWAFSAKPDGSNGTNPIGPLMQISPWTFAFCMAVIVLAGKLGIAISKTNP